MLNDLDKGLVRIMDIDTIQLMPVNPIKVMVDGKEMPLEDLLSRMLGTIRRHGRALHGLMELDKVPEVDKMEIHYPEDDEPNKK